jgi:hypothetical protein
MSRKSSTLSQDYYSSEEEEDPEEKERRRIREEKEFHDRRMRNQVNNAIMKPLVFGLTEDIRYPNHKNPVQFFLENNNNK